MIGRRVPPQPGAGDARRGREDRCARALVAAVWLVMSTVCGVCLVLDTRNVPLVEDWLMVPAMTGHEPQVLASLWAQNAEHRVPLPRALMLLLLNATGDFRAVAALSVALVAALALAFVIQARSFRGRAVLSDAFFPLALLGLGHWENLFWGWQLTFVLPTTLVCVLLLAVAAPRLTVSRGILAGVCLALLPLCGASGLVFAPALAPWLAWQGVRLWAAPAGGAPRRAAGGVLVAAAGAAVVLTALYFVGYERPSWAPNPGVYPSLLAALEFQSLGFGPITRSLWDLPLLVTALFVLATGAVALRAALRAKSDERPRAIGLLLYFGATIVLALAVGWGRAGVIPLYGQWPARYALIALPALLAAPFVWGGSARGPTRCRLSPALLTTAAVLLPLNTVHGLWWRDWYLEGVAALQRDVRAGRPLPELAQRHHAFLFRDLDTAELAHRMRMLQDRGVGPFAAAARGGSTGAVLAAGAGGFPGAAALEQEPAAQPRSPAAVDAARIVSMEIRYRRPEAGSVFLVWGVDRWNPVPESLRPPGTFMKSVLHTPMGRRGGTFVATLRVPSSVTLDYGFLVTRTRMGAPVYVWEQDDDGAYRMPALEGAVAEHRGPPPLRDELRRARAALVAVPSGRGHSGALLLVSIAVGLAAAAAGVLELARRPTSA